MITFVLGCYFDCFHILQIKISGGNAFEEEKFGKTFYWGEIINEIFR